MMQITGIVDRSMTLLAALFGKPNAPADKSVAAGATPNEDLRDARQEAADKQNAPRHVPGYRLLFCLRSQDNGSAENPVLQPLVDAEDEPLTFTSVGAAMQYRSRLGRISEDLVYYAVGNSQAR